MSIIDWLFRRKPKIEAGQVWALRDDDRKDPLQAVVTGYNGKDIKYHFAAKNKICSPWTEVMAEKRWLGVYKLTKKANRRP